MQMKFRRALGAFALSFATILAAPADAQRAPGTGPLANVADGSPDASVMVIPARAQFPLTKKISLGVGRSMMLQFPMELRDVMVGDPTKLDAVVQTSDRVFLIAKVAGSTNAFFFDAQGNQIMTLEISIGSDLGALDSLLKRLIPSSNIRTELAGTAIVLAGSVRTPGDANRASDIAFQFASANQNLTGGTSTFQSQSVGGVTTVTGQSQSSSNSQTRDGRSDKKIINLLSIEGEDQVMLKVSVAEVQRTVLKQFGINFASQFSVGPFSFAPMTSNSFPVTSTTLGGLNHSGVASGAAPAGSPGCASILPSIGNGYVNSPGVAGGFSTPGGCISYILQALERNGLVRMLAEPNLTAVSGESAKFLAGGEYPVPVSTANGTIGITFKEYGVGVAFTPTVMSEGRISLKIDTQVSELSNDGALVLSGTQIPSLTKRSALSTVELPSGGSIAMAGLLSDTTRSNIDGMPGLKDMPILGTLFSSKDYQKSETELVIIVTPILVRPTAASNLAKPTDGLAAASDLKSSFLGHLNRVYGKGRPMPDGGLKGDYGFIVE